MIPRLLQLPKDQSFFLFGPRNTGKSTLVNSSYNKSESIFFNLLDPNLEDRFARHPKELAEIVRALPEEVKYVILDEVQKLPKLLNVIHELIETTNKNYIMTGSSARKLKYGSANLLAGRAFVYNLFSFNIFEIENIFNLEEALAWGLLPKIFSLERNSDRKRFLDAYSHTYLKEEIWAEHFIKNLDPFRRFLEIAAQMNGKIINVHKIASDVGVDDKTIKNYYSILEDTLIGYFLYGFENSFRKRLSTKPKFYFFDTGVVRSLSRTLSVPVMPRTTSYGELFENFIILECIKLSSYFNNDFEFSYLRTKDDIEVDLIVDRPARPKLFIEIKSSDNVTRESISSFIKICKDFNEKEEIEAVCFSNDIYSKLVDGIRIIPWKEGLKHYFMG